MIILTRFAETQSGTPGIVDVMGHRWPTMERRWIDNRPFISCVPVGEYRLIPYHSEKYGDTHVLVNHELNVYHGMNDPGRPRDGRYRCLYFHRGNYPQNFNGCGGVGAEWLPEQEMITHTTETCRTVNRLIREEASYKMVIQNG